MKVAGLLAFIGAVFGDKAHERRNVNIIDPSKDVPLSASNPCDFVLYKQCDSRWGGQALGTSKSQTICSAGCAMSSTAMLESSYNRSHPYNPGQLNEYLNTHNGYVNTDLIVWSAVDPLGPYFYQEKHIAEQYIIDGLSSCNGYIANVLNGEHWVLITGYAGNGNFYVNDPGFTTTQYAYSGMVCNI